MKCEASRHRNYVTDMSMCNSGRKGALTGSQSLPREDPVGWREQEPLSSGPSPGEPGSLAMGDSMQNRRQEQNRLGAPWFLLCSALRSQRGDQSGFLTTSHFKFPHQIVCRKGLTKMWKSQTHTIPYTAVRLTRRSLQQRDSELELMHTGFSWKGSPASWKAWPRNHACINSGLMAPSQAPGNVNQSHHPAHLEELVTFQTAQTKTRKTNYRREYHISSFK